MSSSIILLCAISFWVGFGLNASYSQPTALPDTIDLAFGYGRFSYYEVVDDEDRDKIDVGHNEDMGVVYAQYYSLRPDIEDGEYVIYVNDTLRSRCFIKNRQRVGSWVTYSDSGRKASETPYRDGFKHGVDTWYDNGKLMLLTIYAVDTNYLRIELYPSSKVRIRRFACALSQQFNDDGQITLLPIAAYKASRSLAGCGFVGGEEPLKNGVLHGDCFYQYEGLRYDMKFQEGTLQTLTIIRQGRVILDELPIGY